jgi:GT2 family glycosyltransferase
MRPEDLYMGFEENISQPAALNLGIKETDSEYVCIFSNDCFVHNDWLEPVLEGLKSYDIVAPYWLPIKYQERKKDKYLYVRNYRSLGMNAATMSRETHNKIGQFDERLTRLFWDMDYAIRINKLGLSMEFANEADLTSIGSTTITYLEANRDIGEICKYSQVKSIDDEAAVYKEKWGEECI